MKTRLLLAIAVFGIIGLYLMLPRWLHGKGRDKYLARSEASRITDGLFGFSIRTNFSLLISTNEKVQIVDSRRLFEILMYDKQYTNFLESRWINAGRLVDPWTNGYTAYFIWSTNSGARELSVKVQSFGPNKIDDHGKKDDIMGKPMKLYLPE